MVTLQFDPSRNIATFTASGPLTLKAATEACLQWSAHKDFSATASILADVTDSDWHAAAQQFQLMEDAITQRVNEVWQGRKVAWLVQSQTEVALINSHLATAGWQAHWRAFTNPDIAIEWLIGGPQQQHECINS